MHAELAKPASVPADRDSSPAAPAPMTSKLKIKAVPSAMPATVTVVIPCYNYARYLPAAVASALSQQAADVDVIVVDDRSTDDSLAVARELADADARVRVIAHESNAGPVQTFNDGLAAARGEFLVRLDADDMLTPGSLRRALAVMQHFPSVGLAYGHPIHFIDGALPAHRDRATSWAIWPGRDWLAARCRSGYNAITSPEVLMRRSVVDVIGGQMPLAHTHDMEMWLRIAAISDIGRVRGADQAYYRVHALSMQQTVHAGFLFDLVARNRAFQSVFEKEGASLPERDELYGLAKRALALTAIRRARRLCDFPFEDDLPPAKYRDFAVSLWPEIVGTFSYRALQSAESRDSTAGGFRRNVARQAARFRKFVDGEIFNRIEWRWARYTGTYLPRHFF